MLAVWLLFFSFAFSQNYPSPAGAVNDFAGLLNSAEQQELEQNLRSFFDRTGAAVVVATFDSLAGIPIEDFGVGLFEKWKIGKKGLDNGLLIVIAKAEKKIRFEVGYGLEPVLPDGRCGEIIRTEMAPHFKSGDYSGGIFTGVAAVEEILDHYFATGELPKPASGPADWLPVILVIFAGGIVLFFVITAARKGAVSGYRSRGVWGGFWWGGYGGGGWGGGGGHGGFGGGFGGFGGGSSGGGGATGGW